MSYTVPESPFWKGPQPLLLSQWGGDDPPIGVTGGLRSGFARAVANNRYAYQLRIGDDIAENNKKLRSVGYNPPDIVDTAFHVPVIGAYLSDFNRATDFQAIMADGATIAGPDERYANATMRSSKVRQDILVADKMAEEARIKYPELGIKTTDEMHKGVIDQLKRELTPDPRASWLAGIGEFIGGVGNMASPSDPFAPVKTALAGFGGVGASTATRVVTMAATFAGLGLAEQATDPASRRKALGLPDQTTGDLLYSTAMNFAFGAAFGVLGEGLAGQAGREALNESYSWLSLSKRAAKIEPLRKPPPPPPEAPPPGPPVPTTAELAARPAGPRAFQRLGEGLPSLPRGKLPTTAEEYFARQAPTEGAVNVNQALDVTEGSAIAYVPRDQRVRTAILNNFDTKATKVRQAKQLDQVMAQLMTDGVAPQDIIAATRALEQSVSIMPDIRVYQGPGVGAVRNLAADFKSWISAHVNRLTSLDPKSDVAETAARQFDPETWDKSDKILRELNNEKIKLQRIIDLHAKAAAGDKRALDQVLMAHETERMRARTPAGRARVLQEMKASQDYYKSLQKVRSGGERPAAPRHLDQTLQAERVMALEARRDALYPDIEASFANSQGLLDLTNEEREALETYIRGTTRDWINGSFRYPKGTKRLRKDKNPYDIKQITGPSKKELFAQRELDMAQLSDPLAKEGAKPGEGPADIAIRVNEAVQKNMDETTTEGQFNIIGKFMEDQGILAKATGEAEKVAAPKTELPKNVVNKINADWMKDPSVQGGWRLDLHGNIYDAETHKVIGYLEGPSSPVPKPVVPRLPSGEAYGNLLDHHGFEVDGKDVDMATMWKDIRSEIEALDAFKTCSVKPYG